MFSEYKIGNQSLIVEKTIEWGQGNEFLHLKHIYLNCNTLQLTSVIFYFVIALLTPFQFLGNRNMLLETKNFWRQPIRWMLVLLIGASFCTMLLSLLLLLRQPISFRDGIITYCFN